MYGDMSARDRIAAVLSQAQQLGLTGTANPTAGSGGQTNPMQSLTQFMPPVPSATPQQTMAAPPPPQSGILPPVPPPQLRRRF